MLSRDEIEGELRDVFAKMSDDELARELNGEWRELVEAEVQRRREENLPLVAAADTGAAARVTEPPERGARPQLTVWYNTRCPVCNGGIKWQRSRLVQAARDGNIAFRDINLEPDALSRHGKTLADVRRRLHGVDAAGKLYVGVDCAIEIWRLTPGDAWLAGLMSLPVVRPAARIAYDRFADALYAWNHWNGRC